MTWPFSSMLEDKKWIYFVGIPIAKSFLPEGLENKISLFPSL